MERLHGPINSCYIGEHLDVNLLEFCSFGQEEQGDNNTKKMPFLQMLQSSDLPPFFPLKEPSFQALLKLQHLKMSSWGDIGFSHSSMADELVDPLQYSSSSPVKSEIFDLQNPPSIDQVHILVHDPTHCTKPSPPVVITREKRKRKRTSPTKNKEEVESQRMTHIAVERNRRRLMNEHLSSLRALMPLSYIQRGDQASIVGGAIDFVKVLEQLLQSLEAQKRIRRTEEPNDCQMLVNGQEQGGGGVQVRKKSEVAEIDVTVIQNHVNLKVHCRRRPSQLLRAVVAFEELRLTVLHLNVTSSYTTVLYNFSLKMEEECRLGSADEVLGAVHQIFSIINGS